MSKPGKKILDNKAKVRIFGFHVEWHKILTFAFFLLLSATFWFILVLRQTFEATIQVPVKYTNMPDSVLLKNELPSTISVVVSDKGLTLFRSFILNEDDTLEINVRNYISADNTLLKDDQLTQLIKNKFEKSTTLLRYNPSRISLEYSLLKSKKIPVIFDGEVTTVPNFLLSGDIEVEPDSVIAYSSEEILNNLNVAFTTSNKFENLDKNSVFKLHIRQQHKVRFRPQFVNVAIPVAEFAQKEVTVPITCLNQPFGTEVVFFPSSVSVSFAVSLKDFNTISADDFSINLDYFELEQATNGVVKLRLTESPNYIQNISIRPASAEFILEKSKK